MGSVLTQTLKSVWYPFELVTGTLGLTSAYQRAAVGMAVGYLVAVVLKPSWAYVGDQPKAWTLLADKPEDADDEEDYKNSTTMFPWFFIPLGLGLIYGTVI